MSSERQKSSIEDVKGYLTQDILEFNTNIEEKIEQINSIKTEFETKTEDFDFNKLLKHRILSSNTLRDGKDLESWDAASKYVASSVHKNRPLTYNELIEIHSRLFPENSEIRKNRIYTCDEEYLPPEFLDNYLTQFETHLKKYESIPLFQAFTAYYWVVTLHPFENANGRVSRLAGDWILLSNGYVPICFASPISSHVAQTINGQKRNLLDSFMKYLNSLEYSYQVMKK